METKICAKCGEELSLSKFSKRAGDKKDGCQSWCKECMSAYSKARYVVSREKTRTYREARRAARREKSRIHVKEYRAAHREESRARSKAYYAANGEEARAYRRAYYAANREKINIAAKEYRRKIRMAALDAYGGAVCVLCGETILEFLCIDHIHGGGKKHVREVGRNLYWWLKKNKYPPGFRVLCWNCNWKEMLRLKKKNEAAYIKYQLKLKLEVFEAYGGKCACCGEADPDVLCIDHVNNDGAAHIITGFVAMAIHLISNCYVLTAMVVN